MSIPEVIPVFREIVYLRSHIDAWNRGVRLGKREFPKGKLGCFCLEEKEEEMGAGQGRHKQQSSPELPSRIPYLHSVIMPRGAGALPTSFQPSQGGTRREDLIPLSTAHRISFALRKPSHPQPLPLSSQKFFTLDLHGDPREVRCLQELTIDGEMHIDIHTLQIKYTLCYIVYTNLSEDLPTSPNHCWPWSEFCPLGSTDLAPFVRTLSVWPPPMGTQVCDAGCELRQVERGTRV